MHVFEELAVHLVRAIELVDILDVALRDDQDVLLRCGPDVLESRTLVIHIVERVAVHYDLAELTALKHCSVCRARHVEGDFFVELIRLVRLDGPPGQPNEEHE